MEGNTMKTKEGKMEEKNITQKNMPTENADVEKKQKKPEIINKTGEELLSQLMKRIEENHLEVDTEKIKEAFTLANESHIGQKRRSGENYILHPVEVAGNTGRLCVWIQIRLLREVLHDVVEDTIDNIA